MPATVYQKEAAWLPVLRFFLRASASPREPVPALIRMVTANGDEDVATPSLGEAVAGLAPAIQTSPSIPCWQQDVG